MKNKFFENKIICKNCGGKCCKNLPGSNFPDDFDLESGTEKLIHSINSGKYAIDTCIGDPGDNVDKIAYYVRPATKNAIGKIYDDSWGGECVFLTRTGCELEAKNRPSGCTALEPKKDICVVHNNKTKQNSAIQWRKYFDILDSFH